MKTLVGILLLACSLQVSGQLRDRGDNFTDPELWRLYVTLSELSLGEQRHQMWGLSSRTKAALWTYNIERYLRYHPEIDPDSRDVLLDGERLIASPGWFDIQEGSIGYEAKAQALQEHKRRVQAHVPPDIIVEVFIRLGREPMANMPHQPGVVALGDGGECTCASWYDCPLWPGENCHDSWCVPLQHCGFYDDEVCVGRCKLG